LTSDNRRFYRPVSRRPAGAGPGRGRPGDELIVEVAKANPTDGSRMVTALATRELGEPVNRKRAQRVMRQHRLLQCRRNTDRDAGRAISASRDRASSGTWT
jgi:putative transposase